MDSPSAFFYQNTNLLVIRNAKSQASGGGIINNAIGTAEVQRNGVTVASGGPVSLNYIAGSQGQYEAVFPATVDVPLGVFIKILIKLSVSSALVYRGILEAKVVENG